MNFATSYFYQVRFFRPYMIPVSTAVSDPKWFHNFQDGNHCFIDKNGVINGLRCNYFVPDNTCRNLCHGVDSCNTIDSGSCVFLQQYSEQLNKIDADNFIQNMRFCDDRLHKLLQIDDEFTYVFLVHEKYNDPCSERKAIQQWLTENVSDTQELIYPI